MNSLVRWVRTGMRAFGVDVVRSSPAAKSPIVRAEFDGMFANAALQTLLDHYTFSSVLDVGCGAGDHTTAFLRYGKRVTAVDYGRSIYFEKKPVDLTVRLGDFNEMQFAQSFDCVWASHVLEHQPDAHRFISRLVGCVADEGIIAITVPPLKHQIVGGHLSLWNAGLLLYHLVFAGVDCREAAALRYGYNISVIVRRRLFEKPQLAFDSGDVNRLSAWLPPGLNEGFHGDLGHLNWPGPTR